MSLDSGPRDLRYVFLRVDGKVFGGLCCGVLEGLKVIDG